jgi:RNA polymerase sigma factor (sigma-70 family)
MTPASPARGDGGAPADADLVRRSLGGEPDAYGELVRRHQEGIYRYLRGMTLDHDTSLDLVQDAFVRAYERLDGCHDPVHFRAWAYRIARNLCLDHLKNVRRLSPPLSSVADDAAVGRCATPELDLTLRAALARLPDALRESFLLRHDAGYSYDEIARMTDASVSAVKMRVHRARESLREFLARQGIDAA